MLNSLQSSNVPQSKVHTKGMGEGHACTAGPGQARLPMQTEIGTQLRREELASGRGNTLTREKRDRVLGMRRGRLSHA